MNERCKSVCNFMPGSKICNIVGKGYGLRFLKKTQLIGSQWLANGKEVSEEELVSLGYAEKIVNE